MPKGFGPKPPKVAHCYLQGSTNIEGFSPQQPKSSTPNTVIYMVLQCQKVLAPNLQEVPQCQTLLFTGFRNAKRFWPPTSRKFCNAKHCYLQGSTKITGFSPKETKTYAKPNTVIYKVPQCQKVLAPNLPDVLPCQTLLFIGFRNAKRFWHPSKSSETPMSFIGVLNH